MTYFDNIQLQMIAAYTSDDLTAAFTPQSPGKKFRGEKSANEKQIKRATLISRSWRAGFVLSE